MQKFKAYSLLEVMTTFAIMAIIGVSLITLSSYQERAYDLQKQQAVTELREIAKAIQLFSLDNGYYPADVGRNTDPGVSQYLSNPDFDWSTGPLPGTEWDYENWIGATCVESYAEDVVQITLRNVPNRNPDGSDVWAWYVSAIPGKFGSPHCNDSNQIYKGECVNCDGFDIDADV